MSSDPEERLRGKGEWASTRSPEATFTTVALLAVTAAAWVWTMSDALAVGRQGPSPTDAWICDPITGMCLAPDGPAGVYSSTGAVAYLVAWGVMMAAMMLPSSAPMISMYAAGRKRLAEAGQKSIPAVLFVLVYLGVWLACGVPAYLGGLLLRATTQRYPAAIGVVPYAFGATLLAAGAFQFTRLKTACLQACQDPLTYVLTRWRGGYWGTLRLALGHALFCVGCCWGLMVVLLAAGTMSVPWMLLITAAVSAEKLIPAGRWPAWIVGVGLLAAGLVVVARPDLAALMRGPGM